MIIRTALKTRFTFFVFVAQVRYGNTFLVVEVEAVAEEEEEEEEDVLVALLIVLELDNDDEESDDIEAVRLGEEDVARGLLEGLRSFRNLSVRNWIAVLKLHPPS